MYLETDATKAMSIHWRMLWLKYTVVQTKHTYTVHLKMYAAVYVIKNTISNDMLKLFMYIHQELLIQQQKKILQICVFILQGYTASYNLKNWAPLHEYLITIKSMG